MTASRSAFLLKAEPAKPPNAAIPLPRYFSSAETVLNQAAVYGISQDVENQYVSLYRFTSLVLETIPKHPAFKSDITYQQQHAKFKQKCLAVMEQLEVLKKQVDQVKGPTPKPPPKPQPKPAQDEASAPAHVAPPPGYASLPPPAPAAATPANGHPLPPPYQPFVPELSPHQPAAHAPQRSPPGGAALWAGSAGAESAASTRYPVVGATTLSRAALAGEASTSAPLPPAATGAPPRRAARVAYPSIDTRPPRLPSANPQPPHLAAPPERPGYVGAPTPSYHPPADAPHAYNAMRAAPPHLLPHHAAYAHDGAPPLPPPHYARSVSRESLYGSYEQPSYLSATPPYTGPSPRSPYGTPPYGTTPSYGTTPNGTPPYGTPPCGTFPHTAPQGPPYDVPLAPPAPLPPGLSHPLPSASMLTQQPPPPPSAVGPAPAPAPVPPAAAAGLSRGPSPTPSLLQFPGSTPNSAPSSVRSLSPERPPPTLLDTTEAPQEGAAQLGSAAGSAAGSTADIASLMEGTELSDNGSSKGDSSPPPTAGNPSALPAAAAATSTTALQAVPPSPPCNAPLPTKAAHKPGVIRSIPSEALLKEDYERLSERLKLYGLKEKVVRGDGNCQFRAIADQLMSNPNRHEETRRAVIDQLRAKPDHYQPFVPDDYSGYVDKMAREGTWGDHLTLQAAADAFGVRLCVITSYQDSFIIEIKPKQLRNRKVLWLSFWAEIHYNSVYPDSGNWD